MVEQLLNKIDTGKIVSDIKNLYTHLLGGGFAELARTPSTVIRDEPHCTVRRYTAVGDPDPTALPVLLVPPLGAPATALDLRQGCSLAEFFVEQNRPTYLVDYGDVSTQVDADLGLENWIENVIPAAVGAVSEDNDGADVQLIGWSLGGIMAVFTQAADNDLPIGGIAGVGSPFDFSKLNLFEPIRIASHLTGGKIAPQLIRVIGGVPGRMNTFGFKFADPLRLVQKPKFVLKNRDRPDVLAQIEAVDALMDTMEAYPGKTVAQMYKSFITKNQIAEGTLKLGDRTVSLSGVTVPVMNIAGDADEIFGPRDAVYHLAKLVPNAPRVRMETAHGGHMGVLAGSGARDSTWKYLNEFLKENDQDYLAA